MINTSCDKEGFTPYKEDARESAFVIARTQSEAKWTKQSQKRYCFSPRIARNDTSCQIASPLSQNLLMARNDSCRTTSKAHGFTLLELMMVIIIVGILAAIALPQYVNALEKAKSVEAVAHVGAFRTSMERYWYEQVGTGFYRKVTTLDVLDVTISPEAKWLYTLVDKTIGIKPEEKSYYFRAEKKDDKKTWLELNYRGEFRKSVNLGGTGVHFD